MKRSFPTELRSGPGARVRAALALLCVCALALAIAPIARAEEQLPDPASLSKLLSSASAGGKLPAIGRVENIAIGSKGATVTLEGGEDIRLDFSGLSGVSGSPNYVGWGMLLFGLSVVTRLLQTLSRLVRPFAPRRRRRRYDDYE